MKAVVIRLDEDLAGARGRVDHRLRFFVEGLVEVDDFRRTLTQDGIAVISKREFHDFGR